MTEVFALRKRPRWGKYIPVMAAALFGCLQLSAQQVRELNQTVESLREINASSRGCPALVGVSLDFYKDELYGGGQRCDGRDQRR